MPTRKNRGLSGLRVLAMVALALGAQACTTGVVDHAVTHEPLGNATVKFRAVDARVPASRTFGAFALGTAFTSSTWASGEVKGLYYLNPYAGSAATWQSRAVTGGWNKIEVSKTGYDTRRIYRDHVYSRCSASTKNSVSNTAEAYSPYAANDPTNKSDAQCASQNLSLYPSDANHEIAPDLFVDPRAVADIAFSGSWPNRELNFSVGVANGGDGVYEVEYELTGQVRQRVYRRDGSFTEPQLVPEGKWIEARLRPKTTACSAPPFDDELCPVLATSNDDLPPCRLATEYVFDSSYPAGVGQTTTMCPPLQSGTMVLGLSTGKASLHKRAPTGGGAGTHIKLGSLPPGLYWLEVEVNAEVDVNGEIKRAIHESDYSNNITRIVVQL